MIASNKQDAALTLVAAWLFGLLRRRLSRVAIVKPL